MHMIGGCNVCSCLTGTSMSGASSCSNGVTNCDGAILQSLSQRQPFYKGWFLRRRYGPEDILPYVPEEEALPHADVVGKAGSSREGIVRPIPKHHDDRVLHNLD